MALSRDQMLDKIWVYLDDKTRQQYNEGELGDEDLIAFGVQQGWVPADFSQVEGSASTRPIEPSYGEAVAARTDLLKEDLGSLIDSLQGGVQAAGAGIFQGAADIGAGIVPGMPAWASEQAAQGLRGQAQTNQQAAADVLAQREGMDRFALQTSQDVAASLPSLASLINPALAPIAGLQVLGQEYDAARQGNVSPTDALLRALPQAGAEYAFERLPIGRFADEFLPVADELIKVPARAGLTAIAEGVSEGLTSQVQMGIDAVIANTSKDKDLREFARGNLPQDITQWWEETSRSLAAGALMGGGVGAPMQAMRAAAEKGKLASNLLSTLDAQADNDETARQMREVVDTDLLDQQFDDDLIRAGNEFLDPTLPDPLNQANDVDPSLPLAPVVPTAPVAAPVVPAKPRKTITQKKADLKDVSGTIDKLLSGLSQETSDVTPSGVTMRDVGTAIVDRLGRGDAQVAARLLVNGNVRLVQSEADIPTLDQSKKTGTAGYYDGRQAYIVADHLDPKNIVGELLSVAAHEVKHAGDLSADPTLRTSLGEFVGQTANTRLNRQIETLASQGNPQAKAAVEAAKNTNAYELELPAYFINEARTSRDPGVKGVLNNVVSAVRTTAKKVIPGQYDVNLDDVAYLSDQLLKQTAVQNPDLTQEGDAPNFLEMIVGKKATSFNEQERKGLVYKSRDGNLKTWMSDADSRVVLHEEDVWELKNNNAVQDMPLTDMLEHKQLFKEYPQLKDLKVSVRDMGEDALGSYSQAGKRIALNAKMFKGLKPGSRYFNNQVHRILLHEIQHAVQDIEGFDSGTSPERILAVNPDYFANLGFVNTATAELANFGLKIAKNDKLAVAKQLGLRDVTALPIFEKALSMAQKDIAKGAARDTEEMFATAVVFAMELAKNDATRTLEVSRLIDTFNEINVAKAENDKLYSEATEKYRAKLGETEANYTENNIDVTEDGMDIRSDVASINPELAYGDTWTGRTPPTSLSMAANVIPHATKVGDDPKAMSKLDRAVKRLLFPSGGLPAELNEIVRHGSSLPASLAVNATQLGHNFLEAIKTNAKKLHLPEDTMREQIGKRIEAIDNLDSKDARTTAVAALNRDFPGVGKTLNDLREYKLNLTRELIAIRKRDPKAFSKKELAIYNKMVQNAERYTTRAYLATYNNDLGKLYGKHLLERAKEDPNSKEGKVLEGALQYLANNELIIPPADAMSTMNMEKLRRVYQAWVGNPSQFTGAKGRKAMIDRLSNLPPRTQEMVDKKAMEVVRDMLGQNEKVRSALFHTPSGRQNRTILEARTDLPEPLRKLMGEITDPVLRESISLQRMINLTTKTKVLTEIFEKGAGTWWTDERTDANQRQLNNIAYGPLDGKWINQDVEDAITGTILSLENFDNSLAELMNKPDAVMQAVAGAALKPMRGIMALQKTTQVVMSPINMLMNFGGALALMAPAQGLINPKVYWEGIKNTAQVLGREISTEYGSPESNAAAAELLKAGVTDSATMGEFRGEQFQVIRNEIEKMIEDGSYTPTKLIKTVWNGVKESTNAARQFYAFMDVWVKASTYYDRKNFLTEYNKAENMGWTDEDIIRRAGYEAAGTNVSYERSIPLARVLEQNVPFFMFLTYFSETFRATAMSFLQAGKDFQMAANAKTQKGFDAAMLKGTTRLTGTLAATVGLQQAVMSLLDSEDDEEKKKRQIDADYMEGKIIIPMGINDDGNEVMVELQRLDPIGPMNEFLIKLQTADPKERAQAMAQGVFDMFVESRGVLRVGQVMTDALTAAAANALDDPGIMEWDARRKKNTVLERNYPAAYEMLRSGPFGLLEKGDIGENVIAAAEQLLLPAGITPFVDAERTQVTEVREGDATVKNILTGEKEPIHPFLRAAGYKAYVRDPHMSVMFRSMDYGDAMDQLRAEANDLNERAAGMDGADLIDRLNSIRSQEKDLFDDMYRAREGFMAFENTKAKEFDEIIRDKTLANQLRSGKFKSRLIDGEALERWYDRAKKERGVDKQALREEYQLLKRLYRESDRAAK